MSKCDEQSNTISIQTSRLELKLSFGKKNRMHAHFLADQEKIKKKKNSSWPGAKLGFEKFMPALRIYITSE